MRADKAAPTRYQYVHAVRVGEVPMEGKQACAVVRL